MFLLSFSVFEFGFLRELRSLFIVSHSFNTTFNQVELMNIMGKEDPGQYSMFQVYV